MRLPSLLACSLSLVGLLSSSVSAQTNIEAYSARVMDLSASWSLVSAAGCRQDIYVYVSSYRFLLVQMPSHSIIRESSRSPYLDVIVNQWDSPGCEGVTISNLIDNLSTAQFTRNGVSSATVNVDQIVLSDPLIGKYVIDVHLHWTGVGSPVTTTVRDRFCEEEVCVWGKSVVQNRNATVTGTVTATVHPLFGSIYTANYSPSVGTQLTANLNSYVSTVLDKF